MSSQTPPEDPPLDPSVQPKELVPRLEEEIHGVLPKEFEQLPESVRRDVLEKVSSATINITTHSTWEGTYPPPDILAGYEKIQHGFADRVFRMAEIDLLHAHEMQNHLSSYMTRGQIIGFILALIAILGSIYLIHDGTTGAQIAGSILGASVIIPLVTLFVRGHIASTPSQDGEEQPQGPKRQPPSSY